MLLAIFFLLVIYSEAVYVYCSGFLYMLSRVFSANITCLYNIVVSGGQVVLAMPPPFVPYNYIGDPD